VAANVCSAFPSRVQHLFRHVHKTFTSDIRFIVRLECWKHPRIRNCVDGDVIEAYKRAGQEQRLEQGCGSTDAGRGCCFLLHSH